MRRVAAGNLANAFAFIGAGGHHAGRRTFGGYCCFNDVCIGIAEVRRLGLASRVAILDTDAHHGDGTREIVQDDPAVLHVCVCGTSHASGDGTKRDLAVAWDAAADPDGAYLAAVRPVFPQLCRSFRPDLVVWYFGFDGHRGDYGDMGLSAACFRGLADLMVAAAAEAAGGRLVVVLGGGSRTDLATALIPSIIARLADASALAGC
jgi:acetoin utilization deacetylase AcuC-like enzyme